MKNQVESQGLILRAYRKLDGETVRPGHHVIEIELPDGKLYRRDITFVELAALAGLYRVKSKRPRWALMVEIAGAID